MSTSAWALAGTGGGRQTSTTVLGWYSVAALAIALEMLVVAMVNPASAAHYLWFLLVAALVYRFTTGTLTSELPVLYAYYAGLTLALYFAHVLTLPEYLGFSGGFGIGTDDSYYYSLAAEQLPAEFPTRPNYYLQTHTYSTLLSIAAIGGVKHPLDVLFFNAAFLPLLPRFTADLAERLTANRSVARLSYLLVLICPWVMVNGVVATRDGVTAALFVGSSALFLRRRYLASMALGALLFYMRIASGLQLMLALIVFGWLLLAESPNPSRKAAFMGVAGLIGIAAGYLALPGIVAGIAESGILAGGLFRTQFLDYLASSPGASVLADLGSVSALVRSPVSVAYFLSAPFLGLDELVRDGILRPRAIMTTIFAIMSVAYMKYFVQGVLAVFTRRTGHAWLAVTAYILLIFFLAHVSLVIRHKTMLMPLFYIIVALGALKTSKLGVPLGNAAAAALIGAQIVALMVW